MIALLPVLFPAAAGLVLLLSPEWKNRKNLCIYTGTALIITGVLALLALAFVTDGTEIKLFNLTKALPLFFRLDGMSRLFACATVIVWIGAGMFSFSYMRNGVREKRFYGFYLIVFGVLLGLDFSGNLITFYGFYELMTLCSLPLVLHEETKEAVMAGLKYLFYSLFGAYMVLFGLYFLNRFTNTLTFTGGGVLDSNLAAGNEGFLLFVAFLMLLGFGVKAGMFPLHGWLPTAHPLAPAPASGALSGIIVKAGVLGIIRLVYYIFGADFLRSTWVQHTWIVLALITVLMGSMMALRERGLKKRLAYSTVSQVSYILLGLAMLEPSAMTGALLHTAVHAFVKCSLFLAAGAIICQTGKTQVQELRGIGKEMPVTLWCFTIGALVLIGIPPSGGFLSKWYLASGSLRTGIPVLSVLAPVILLISAVLTAGYLLPVSVRGFLPGEDYEYGKLQKKEPGLLMLLPILLLAALAVGIGIFPGLLTEWLGVLTESLFS